MRYDTPENKDYYEGHAEGYEDGFRDGYESGYEDGVTYYNKEYIGYFLDKNLSTQGYIKRTHNCNGEIVHVWIEGPDFKGDRFSW